MPALTLPGSILQLKILKSKTNVRFYTVDGLNPGVGYTVCFSTIYGKIQQGMEKAMDDLGLDTSSNKEKQKPKESQLTRTIMEELVQRHMSQ